MQITIENRQSDLPILESQIETLVREVLSFYAVETDELIVQFVGEDEITRLHGDFFDDPTPTDCITFPIDDPEESASGKHVLGEIFISPKAAKNYSSSDPYTELSLYIVHGILHLLGHDDIDSAKKQRMRAEEDRAISHLKTKKCILSNPPSYYT